MDNYKFFETERLFLKPTTKEDAEFILDLLNSPKWLQYIGDRNVKTIDDAEVYINERMLPQLKRLGFSNYTVIRKADGVKIGSCGLYNREGLNGIDIGYALLPQYEKKGYAYESVNKILQAAKDEFNLKEVKAITTKENKGSQKLLDKLGMTFQKIINIPNDNVDLMLYKISL